MLERVNSQPNTRVQTHDFQLYGGVVDVDIEDERQLKTGESEFLY